jgi:hypothetical protein
MTSGEIQDLAAEIILEIRSDGFDGDRWLGNQNGVSVVAAVLPKQVSEIRKRALLDAAKDVCMYCSGNALNFLPAEPANNGSGNWVHRHKVDTEGRSRTLCNATAIHSRMRYEGSQARLRDEGSVREDGFFSPLER